MIEIIMTFLSRCNYIILAVLFLYLVWLLREYWKLRKTGIVRAEIVSSDDEGEALIITLLFAETLIYNYIYKFDRAKSEAVFLKEQWHFFAVWSFLVLCVIIKTIIKHKGFHSMKRNIICAILSFLDTTGLLVERCGKSNWRWILFVGIAVIAKCMASLMGISLLQNEIGFFVFLAMLLLIALGSISKAMHSATWLCITWCVGSLFFCVIVYGVYKDENLFKSVINRNIMSAYGAMVFIMIAWWCITICWAEDRVAKIAATFISTLIGLITAIINIVLLVMAPLIEEVQFDVSPDVFLSLAVNLCLLPLLTASLLSKLIKELQIYWREKYCR